MSADDRELHVRTSWESFQMVCAGGERRRLRKIKANDFGRSLRLLCAAHLWSYVPISRYCMLSIDVLF